MPPLKSAPAIVVLDGFTVNPGDLDWSPLRALGDCCIYDRTPDDKVVHRACGAQVVLTNKTVLSREVLESLPDLRYIGVLATGYNVVDLQAAAEREMVVTNVPGYSTPSVAQLVFALILELTHHVGHHAQTVRDGRWSASTDFCYWEYPLLELAGKTLGIVGYGQIGRSVAQIGRAFGMRIIAPPRTARPLADDLELVALDDLFRQADVVSLHCPLSVETRGMVSAARLSLMKPSAFLINTSRGPLVVEHDLAEALNAGRLAGAGLDVLALEPPTPDNPLLQARNCLVTPHIGWASLAARRRLLEVVVANLRGFLEGKPQNVVKAAQIVPRQI